MRITIISPVFPYPKKGVYVGIERHVYEYSKALLKKGHEVNVITTFWNGGKEREEYNGIKIYRVGDSSLRFGKIGRLFDLHYYSFGKNLLKYRNILEKADIVHALMPLSSAKELEVPLVSHFHHYESIERFSHLLYKPFHHQMEKKAYLNSNVVIVPSEYSKEVLCSVFSIPKKKVVVVPHGVDISRFSGKTTKKSKNLRLLFVGPLEERKGIRYLIEALAMATDIHKNVELIVIGDGRERKNLESLVKRLELKNIEFKGYLEDEELIEHYNMADIFVFPSLKEGFGQVLVEAMACGLPIVATDASAIPEVVGNAGILVGPKDPKALANAIRMLIDDEELRDELGERGRKRVEENFTWEKVVDQTVRVYKETIGSKRR